MVAIDEDLADRPAPATVFRPQDPDPAAHTSLEPDEAQREAGSALTGGGAVGGAAAPTPV